MKKKRLDQLLVEREIVETFSKAQALILAGEIFVEKKRITKAGEQIPLNAEIQWINTKPKYVSRGGIKLAKALEHFLIQPFHWYCLDIGASTGGFTDCLLQNGADHVFALDVGKGQLDPKIRHDIRVTWKESFHVKKLKPEHLIQLVDLVVIDVSFISLQKVAPFVVPCIQPSGILLALIKPQFEAPAKDLSKGGVLRDENRRQKILYQIVRLAENEWNLKEVKTVDAAIKGPKGNQETFLFGRKI